MYCIVVSREWLSGLVSWLWSEVFRFDSRNCWFRLPHSLLSRIVLPGVQETMGCPHTSSLCCLPRRSEFPLLTLRLRRSTFAMQKWLVAGSTTKELPRNRGVLIGYKTYYTFIVLMYQVGLKLWWRLETMKPKQRLIIESKQARIFSYMDDMVN